VVTELFRRAWKLEIGGLEIDATDGDPSMSIAFKVMRSLKKEPNSIELDMFNLSSDHRSEIEAMSEVDIVLSAGYVGSEDVIFSGDLRVARNLRRLVEGKNTVKITRQQLEVVTEIDGEDGGKKYRENRVNKSYVPGTPISTALADVVTAMGIGTGNLGQFSGETITGIGATFAEGMVLFGKAEDELDRLVKSMGLTWSVQGGNLQLIQNSVPLMETAVELTQDTGLVGSPTKESDGTIKATSLLIPELYPGRKVVLKSKDLDAQTIVNRVTFSGETDGNDWNAELELKEY
jgi:hypothetical protein